ncbi:thymidine phosphorylase [Psychromonas hadalis]|uniref:thymidine phosphorylase n=1 Tax=Psychromonas hadalis TaxID=211669 RepID=UPI0003B3F283|nr:thymidine phosphorylase [Psychromonas hadalis]
MRASTDTAISTNTHSQMVSALSGPTDFVEKSKIYSPKTNIIRPVYATQNGFVCAMDTKAIGMAVVKMGGGYMSINYAVGFNDFVSLGKNVDINKPLAMIHAQNELQWLESEKIIQQAISYTECKPKAETQIYQHIRSD